MNLEFLKAERFWVMVIGITCTYLSSKGYIGQDEIIAIDSFCALFIGIRTVDRHGEMK